MNISPAAIGQRVTALGQLYCQERYWDLVQEAQELYFVTPPRLRARVCYFWSQALLQLNDSDYPFKPVSLAHAAYRFATPASEKVTTAEIDEFVRYGCHYADVLRTKGSRERIEPVLGSLRRYGLSPLSQARYKLAEGRYLFQVHKDSQAAREAFETGVEAQQENLSVYAQALLYLAFIAAVEACQDESTAAQRRQEVHNLVMRFQALPSDKVRPVYQGVAEKLLLQYEGYDQGALRQVEKALKF